MHTNRFRQVAIAVAIFCHQLAHFRQDMEGVSVVGLAQRFDNGFRKLQHQQTSTRLQHAVHRAQRFLFVGHVTQTERDGDAVKGIISKRQGFRVGLNILNVTHDADIAQLFAAHFEH
ncbi:hypothetical protein SB00610_00177 [Klebsiella quasipneumoniae subsp. similipneumoniae]|nr:hypothetical protein SB00610_00177 [Klebsiella quasipneumoniae subsp. similipneumoniae]